ncbi:MAG: DNA repair protein RadC [Thermoanaerobaculia bacterium]
MGIKNLPDSEKPRERLLSLGESALSIQELLAILLRSGPKGRSAFQLAEKILAEIPEEELSEVSVNQLLKIEGVGKVRAITLAAALELHRRLSSLEVKPKGKLSKPQEVAEFLKNKYSFEKQEIMGYILLDNKNQIIRVSVPYKGTSSYAPVEPREIFGPAMLSKGTKIILFHNHPSGDPNPSREDIEFTDKMVELGKKLNVFVIDHIIIGTLGWYSFSKEGLI